MSESRTRLHPGNRLIRSSRHVFRRRSLGTTLCNISLVDRSLKMMLWTTESSFSMRSNSRATTLPPPTLICDPTGTQIAGVNESRGESRRSRKVRRLSSRRREPGADSVLGRAERYHRMCMGQYRVRLRQNTARQAQLSSVISIDPAAKFLEYPSSSARISHCREILQDFTDHSV